MRFLLIRFSSLGDILLQTSFASWLKLEFPGCKVSFLTMKGSEALLENHPHIDEIHTYKKAKGAADFSNLFRFCRNELSGKKFDFVLDLHGTNRSFLTRCFLPEYPALVVDKRGFERFLLVKTKINFLKKTVDLRERNLRDLAWAFGKTFDKKKLLSFIAADFPGHRSLTSSAKTRGPLKDAQERGPKKVVLAPGASFAPKRWPVEKFVELAQMIMEKTDWVCVVIAGPEDDFCREFADLEKEYPQRLRNLQGKLSLSRSLEVVAGCDLSIGNDSLIGHVAEACSIPSFALFGPTSEYFGFVPGLPESKSFSVEKLWCRPCSTTGSRECFRKRRFCMEDIEAQRVLIAAQKLLEDKGRVANVL